MLSTQPWPDVVFAATDIIAIGVYRAIQERDIEIPKDIQVISMNDIPTAQHMNPSLTTMRLYATEMGEAAVDLFMELVAGRQYHKTVQLGYEMIWRKSFAKPL
jgi:LacI family transcriptional regulator